MHVRVRTRVSMGGWVSDFTCVVFSYFGYMARQEFVPTSIHTSHSNTPPPTTTHHHSPGGQSDAYSSSSTWPRSETKVQFHIQIPSIRRRSSSYHSIFVLYKANPSICSQNHIVNLTFSFGSYKTQPNKTKQNQTSPKQLFTA